MARVGVRILLGVVDVLGGHAEWRSALAALQRHPRETEEEANIVPRELWRNAGEQGYLCCWMEEEWGGPGAEFLYSVIVCEELARVRASGVAFGLHSDIVVPYLHSFGTEEQKRRWLPGCARGDLITAVAMTEPSTGSDLAAIRTTAIRDGDHYVLNGQKTFISNGHLCDLVVVAAKTDPKADPPHSGVSLVVVEAGTPGFNKGRRLLKKMGMKSQDTAESGRVVEYTWHRILTARAAAAESHRAVRKELRALDQQAGRSHHHARQRLR